MTYIGRVQDGKIVIDGTDRLEEGSIVRITPVDEKYDDRSLSKALLKLAGTVESDVEDGSINVDHYLYGLPKK